MPLNRRADPRKDPSIGIHREAILRAIAEDRTALGQHPVYNMVEEPEALRRFMTSHAFAVWDFMTLLKRLQRDLTCVEVPWLPVADAESARFINEIVLAEETDEIYPGTYISHFELYVAAMDQVGADAGPIRAFVDAIGAGTPPEQALEAATSAGLPRETADFVTTTLAASRLGTHEVAAVFLYGREDVIPKMFLRLLSSHGGAPPTPRAGLIARNMALKVVKAVERRLRGGDARLPSGPPPDVFRLYLERHIELDGDSHGPMGERLLMNLCGRDVARWEQATDAALDALTARRRLWDGVMKQIQHDRQRLSDRKVARGAGRQSRE